jgi:multidrug resistance efflux pump
VEIVRGSQDTWPRSVFRPGSEVKKDDVLFVIDSRWHEAEYQLAISNVEQAAAQMADCQS